MAAMVSLHVPYSLASNALTWRQVLVEDQAEFRQAMKSAQKAADMDIAAAVRASADGANGTPSRTPNTGPAAAGGGSGGKQPPQTPTLSSRTSGGVEQQLGSPAPGGAAAAAGGDGSAHSAGGAGQPQQHSEGGEEHAAAAGAQGGKGLGKGKLPPKPKRTPSKNAGGSSEIEPADE
jgi:hypothetical protein